MDMQWYGANCIVVTSKHARIVVDDNLAELGSKSVSRAGDIALFTGGTHLDPAQKPKLMVDQPGEYEASGISIYGIATRSHTDEEGSTTATMYKIMNDELSILAVGHVYPELNDEQLEAIGMVDIMFIPVGGNGYTLDGVGALKLAKKIEPKIIIPTHYDDPKLQFPVPQQTLEQALKALAMEPKETLTKLRFKPAEQVDTTQLILMERS